MKEADLKAIVEKCWRVAASAVLPASGTSEPIPMVASLGLDGNPQINGVRWEVFRTLLHTQTIPTEHATTIKEPPEDWR